MKKIYIIGMIFLSFFLVSCDKNGENTEKTQTGGSIVQENISPAKKMVENLATYLQKTPKDVIEEEMVYNSLENEEAIPSFQVSNNSMTSTGAENFDTHIMFDGWVEDIIGDPIVGYFVEYRNDDLICSLAAEMNEKDKYEEYLEKMHDEPEEADKIISEATYTVSLNCSEIPEYGKNPTFFSIQGEHPYWGMVTGKNYIYFDIAGEERQEFYGEWINENEKYFFKPYPFAKEYNEEDFLLTLEKKTCTISSGEEIPYTVEFSKNGEKYEGCGQEIQTFFLHGRIGMAKNIWEKIGIEKVKGFGDDAGYIVRADGYFSEINFYAKDEKNEWIFYNVTLKNTPEGIEILWQGSDEADDETCEKTRFETGLHDFGAFVFCARG